MEQQHQHNLQLQHKKAENKFQHELQRQKKQYDEMQQALQDQLQRQKDQYVEMQQALQDQLHRQTKQHKQALQTQRNELKKSWKVQRKAEQATLLATIKQLRKDLDAEQVQLNAVLPRCVDLQKQNTYLEKRIHVVENQKVKLVIKWNERRKENQQLLATNATLAQKVLHIQTVEEKFTVLKNEYDQQKATNWYLVEKEMAFHLIRMFIPETYKLIYLYALPLLGSVADQKEWYPLKAKDKLVDVKETFMSLSEKHAYDFAAYRKDVVALYQEHHDLTFVHREVLLDPHYYALRDDRIQWLTLHVNPLLWLPPDC